MEQTAEYVKKKVLENFSRRVYLSLMYYDRDEGSSKQREIDDMIKEERFLLDLYGDVFRTELQNYIRFVRANHKERIDFYFSKNPNLKLAALLVQIEQ